MKYENDLDFDLAFWNLPLCFLASRLVSDYLTFHINHLLSDTNLWMAESTSGCAFVPFLMLGRSQLSLAPGMTLEAATQGFFFLAASTDHNICIITAILLIKPHHSSMTLPCQDTSTPDIRGVRADTPGPFLWRGFQICHKSSMKAAKFYSESACIYMFLCTISQCIVLRNNQHEDVFHWGTIRWQNVTVL